MAAPSDEAPVLQSPSRYPDPSQLCSPGAPYFVQGTRGVTSMGSLIGQDDVHALPDQPNTSPPVSPLPRSTRADSVIPRPREIDKIQETYAVSGLTSRTSSNPQSLDPNTVPSTPDEASGQRWIDSPDPSVSSCKSQPQALQQNGEDARAIPSPRCSSTPRTRGRQRVVRRRSSPSTPSRSQTHLPSRAPVQCSVCGRTFHGAFPLRRHMAFHTGEGFACIVCDRGPRDKSDLVEHLRRHLHQQRKKHNTFETVSKEEMGRRLREHFPEHAEAMLRTICRVRQSRF